MTKVIVEKTEEFEKWYKKLKDRRAQDIVSIHIWRIIEGNFGKTRNVGDGVWEKKINYGAGYRLYYFTQGRELMILLCGGDKSTQQADIVQAKELKKGLK